MINELFYNYDEIMLGKRARFSTQFFNPDSASNERNALAVIQYASEEYLGWSKDEFATKMTRAIMKEMHLKPLLEYINFPPEYDPGKDYYYIASLIYKPSYYSLRTKTEHTYELILSGELRKYPKDYFMGHEGLLRASVCLQYAIDQDLIYYSIHELYHFFASIEGSTFLAEHKLKSVCEECFEDPVSYLHHVLPSYQKNEFFHMYYKFKYTTITRKYGIISAKSPDKLDFHLEGVNP